MKKITTTQSVIITIKDVNNDELTNSELYYYNEHTLSSIWKHDIFEGGENIKLATYSSTCYGYDNYTIITNNPILLSLLVECGRIGIDNTLFENISNIPDSKINNFLNMIS